ncbi:hypothetical protein WJX72_005808 [[Myrmecia] bisecta]|uniref:Uncharacterized protein n=1 Tax=[Myrmecia] bisecta TaxID=41462 RepID=A0AAW1QQR9_9CHLO
MTSRTNAVTTDYAKTAAAHERTDKPLEVPPAVLPGTPKDFPIPADKLIQLAKKLFAEGTGLDNPDALTDDFRFEFPVVSLPKDDYIRAVAGFGLKNAFPNQNSHPYDFRVDPYEPHRVWFTVRNTATHTGPLKFGPKTYKATNTVVLGAPECMSYTFNEEGKCTSFTGGYIMDRRVGNTKGLGAVFGILAAIGAPVPSPGSLRWNLMLLTSKLAKLVGGVVNLLTFGIFKSKTA